MKTLQQTIKVFSCAILLLFIGCKKDKLKNAITTDELLNHHIVGIYTEKDDTENIRIFHFSKQDGVVKCTADYISTRRVQTVEVKNNHFTMDMDGDGKIVYTFELAKLNNDSLIIKSASFRNNSPEYKSWTCDMYKSSSITTVKNKYYVGSETRNITFSTNTWVFRNIPNTPGTFYEIFPGAWKGRLSNTDFIGVTIYQRPTIVKMLFQQKGRPGLTTLWVD